VICSKNQIYNKELSKSCDVLFHCIVNDDQKNLNIKGLKNTHIFIFKRSAVFESVLKNILTGRLYEVEFKHLVILVSVIIFFVLVGGCKKDYSGIDPSTLTFFEDKICLNKKTIMSSIAVLFIVTIISSIIKKKIEKKKTK
jgi:hypothetical protein